MGDLTKNFSAWEIECRCGCGLKRISPRLMAMIQTVRDACGFPFHINSGCRCAAHNKNVGGKTDSAHLPSKATGECLALDIAFANGFQLYTLIRALQAAGFKRIGINFKKSFVHADIDEGKPQNTIFSY